MTINTFDGDMQLALIDLMPNGKEKIDALAESVQLADLAKEPMWQQFFRFMYACEIEGYDDPAKVIPIAEEFAALYEETPDAMPAEPGQDAYLMITELGINSVVNLPQISIEQHTAMMERYYDLVRRFNKGYRTYWHQMFRFWQYIDKEKAYEYYLNFKNTPRDDRSDCEACEQSYAVGLNLTVGNREEADELYKPIGSGELSCHAVPQMCWRDYIEDALDRGCPEEAAPLAEKLYRIGDRDKSDLSYIGAVVRYRAYSNPDKAAELVVQRLEWTLGTWDQRKLYDFYKGAWVCFRELAKRQEAVTLELPKGFALHREDGIYSCAALEDWFHNQAESIAKRFDKRNGTDYFMNNMSLA